MSKTEISKDNGEFISLMALLMSLVAMAVDTMLPAMAQIGTSLGVRNPNDNQLIISSVFLGMALGLMLYGPLSDSYGRKNAIFLGMSIFLLGNLISIFSTDFTFMLIGRVFQGFGGCACRVVTVAMIRDKFEGQAMARVMSLIMMFFIMVPALAPSIGQGILFIATWRAIFGFVLAVAIIGVLWLHFRQPETLVEKNRRQFSSSIIFAGIRETFKKQISRTYMIAAGIIFGSFVGYLSSAQQILQIQYELGESFTIYFGSLALVVGVSTYMNSRLVMKYAMEAICLLALTILSITSVLFYVYAKSFSGHPSLTALMVYLAIIFFCFGFLIGNFNALAMQPLGHIAGIANSVISSVQTLLSVVIGGLIGQYYNATVLPLILGFMLCGVSAFVCIIYPSKK
ncbi:MAG: multidrug effflux MFS transporter [Proteobacteria bacterium]|nr:multidrug effflux MFS transporter [Pseudomonadota bacterium]